VLEPTPAIQNVFPHPFSLVYVVTLATHQLSTDLHIQNTSETSSITFQSLLHTYFLCDASTVTVSPLQGLTFIDKTNNLIESTEERNEVSASTYTDAIYKDAPGEYYVWYEGSAKKEAGGVHIKTRGFKDVVVWNPQAEAGRAIADMEEGGW
jgi:glucose-6-phosphate 1-epimerase